MKKNKFFKSKQRMSLPLIVAGSLLGNFAHLAAEIKLEVMGSVNYGLFGESAAEISAFDPATKLLFVTQASGHISVLDMTNPAQPIQKDLLNLGPVNSVAVKNGIVAVAVEAAPKQDAGTVILFSSSDLSTPLNTLTVGALPDMVTFTPDGLKLLVANEGEPDADYLNDPEGSISIISLGDGSIDAIKLLNSSSVTSINFNAYDIHAESLKNKGVRLFGPDATVSQDLEPEYIAVSPDGSTAYVTLQENNAVAVVDLTSDSLVDLLALGTKDHLRGLPHAEVYEIDPANLPVIGISTADDSTPVKMGGFSGLWYAADESDENTHVFYTHGDRGPNGDSFDANGITNREFLLPDFQATIIRLKMDRTTHDITVDSTISLYRADGTTPISGLPNIPGWDEQPLDGKGNVITHDPFGADMEGIVKSPDGTFWMVDEYRPAIYHFLANGTLNARYVPQGTSLLGDTPQTQGFYGTETLPAEYSLRRSNRGFEAVAYDTDADVVYAFIQSPIESPDISVRNKSDVIRILGIDPTTGTPVAEYVYLLERNALAGSGLSRVDKIGDAVYAGNNRFYVIERDSTTPDNGRNGKKFIFEIDLTGATNLLANNAPVLAQGKTLEQHSSSDLALQGIRPVYKSKVANLPSLGYLPSDKAEGLALLPDGSIAVANDNDFTVTGFPTLALGIISFEGAKLDASDRDDAINIANWPIQGVFMPDAIATFSVNGQTFLATANEGDSREYEGTPGYVGEKRIKDLDLDPTAFPNASDLQKNEQIGRLSAMISEGDLDGDGDYDRLFVYGARSFSIWDSYGNLVWDSSDFIESYIAEVNPDNFNSNDENDSFDSRSDNKGPEPEGVITGVIDGRTYAFIGLERIGGIMVFDVSDPTSPLFVQYINNRDFTAGDQFAGDIAPEGLVFISAENSPDGLPLLVVSNEVSGTVTVYGITTAQPSDHFTLNLLHNNDGESQLINAGSGLEEFGGIARFVSLVRDRKRIAAANNWSTLTLSSGDNFLAGPEFNASFVTRDTPNPLYYDAMGLNAIGYDAIVLGNHDFDFGPEVLAEFIAEVNAEVPYLSANLDFTGVSSLNTLFQNGHIASSTTFDLETSAGTKKVTIIGATTPNLPFISSPGKVVVLQNVASIVQAEIDAHSDSDVIVFVSHLQGISEDFQLIKNLSGIDIAIAGGGDDLLANSNDLLLPGDAGADSYPMYAVDADQKNVPIVTTSGEYRYLGNLVVDFDANNEIVGIGGRPLPVASIESAFPGAVQADESINEIVVEPVKAYLQGLAENIIATSDVALDGRRNSVRGTESSMGNLVADSMLWAARQNAIDYDLDGVDIALVGGGGIRNNTILNESAALDAPFSELDTFDILPFSNFVSVVENITPAQLKDQLETTFSQTAVVNGKVVPQGNGTGRFAQIAGLVVQYDPTAQPQILDANGNEIVEGKRVISATLTNGTSLIQNGKPVGEAPSVNIAVTSFHATRGDQWFTQVENLTFKTVGLTYQQALADYVQAPVEEDGLAGDITVDAYGTVGERIVVSRDALIFEWAPFEVLGWRVSEWMGPLYVKHYQQNTNSPWFYHAGFGWLYLGTEVKSSNSVWLANSQQGWFFTNAEIYPYVYSATTGGWYYISITSPGSDKLVIYRLSDGAIVDSVKE